MRSILRIAAQAAFGAMLSSAANAGAALDLDWQRLPPNVVAPRPDPRQPVRLEYAPHAMQCGEEGDVDVQFVIAADGSIGDVALVRSSGFSDLDATGIAALQRARYFPAVMQGMAVPVKWRSTLKFRLNEAGKANYLPDETCAASKVAPPTPGM